MNFKKILSIITVAMLMMAMVVVPASAAATTVIAPQDETVAPGAAVNVEFKMTYAGHTAFFYVSYDETALTYIPESFRISGAKPQASNTSVVVIDENTLEIGMIEDGLSFDNVAVFTLGFTAKAEIEGASENTVITTEASPKGILDGEYLKIDNANIAFEDATVKISLSPAAPTAAPTIDITEPKVGDTLTATSNYSDINGDLESGTTFEWFANGESLGEASTTNTYVVTGAEVGKTITVKAVPKTTVAPTSGEAAESAATAAVAVNPALKATVEGLKFTDESKFKVGKQIFISYDLVSPNAGEDASTIKWTDSEGKDLVGAVAEDGMSFVPAKEDIDKIVKVTVTPKDSLTEANAEAAVFVEAEEAITKAKSNSGSYVPNSGANLAGKEPVEKPEVPAVAFEDVDAEKYAWAVEYINSLAEQGIFKGRDDKTFDPEAKITRAEFVALVARVLGIKSDAEIAFADLDGHWSAAEVTAVATLGEDTLAFFGEAFAPDQAITREEMATVLYKALVAKGVAIPEAEATVFSDASSIAEFAAEAVEALQKFEVINGMGDGTFAPKGETTRAQAAKVIYLFAGLVK